ncbi:MAG: hypothetical protein OHK0013_36860 [Sandaracinaceae bacterium]
MAAPLALLACHPPDPAWPVTSYGIAVEDWQSDFLNSPLRFAGDERPTGLLGVYLSTFAPAEELRRVEIRLFRISDGREIPGALETGRRLDGAPLVTLDPWREPSDYGGFVASEPLEEGWYIASLDARAFRAFGPIDRAPGRGLVWSPDPYPPDLDGIGLARLRIGSSLEWVRTWVTFREDRDEVALTLSLTSTVPASELQGSEIFVLKDGLVVPCSEVFYEDPATDLYVECPGQARGWLAHGDTVEIRLVSDRVGHPMGTLRPQEIVIDRYRDLPYFVAPDMGLDLLRAAYGIEGGGI